MMKRWICGIPLLLLWATLPAQEKKTGLDIFHLTGNFYVYTTYKMINGSPFPSNSLYVVTGKGVVMIDTPWDLEQAGPLLDSIKKKHNKEVVMCLATHYHDDRTGAFDILRQRGIKTYSSTLTRQLCIEKNEKKAQHTFDHDTSFAVGDLQFQTYYPGEGHTKDNIVIWFPREKVLYGGCLFKSTESEGLGNIADANVPEWSAAIRKVMDKFSNAAYVIPGHHGWSKPEALPHTLKLLEKNKSN